MSHSNLSKCGTLLLPVFFLIGHLVQLENSISLGKAVNITFRDKRPLDLLIWALWVRYIAFHDVPYF